MGFFDFFKPARIIESVVKVTRVVAKSVKFVAEKVIDGIDYLTESGKYAPKTDPTVNTKWLDRLTQIRNDMQRDIKKEQKNTISDIKLFFNDLFEKLRMQFEDMDITRLQNMLNDTINENEDAVDDIINDELSVDNERLREIAKCESKEQRKIQYQKYIDDLSEKIEKQNRKNIRKLYNDTLKNARQAYDEEYKKKCLNIDSQIKGISRMIDDNSSSQTESEEVLLDNIQKKIACQLIIDAVENTDE